MSASIEDIRTAVAAYLSRCVRTESGCLVNPAIRANSYGEVRAEGVRMPAHRAVLAVALDVMPSREVVTRHACDNPPCVAVEHLAFGSQSENVSESYDRNRHARHEWPRGEQRSGAVLTEAIVREARRLAADGSAMSEIVARFGTPYSSTRAAVRGETWAHVTDAPAVPGRRNGKPNPHAYRLTRASDAARVAAMRLDGLSLDEIGRALGCSRHTAWRLAQIGAAA